MKTLSLKLPDSLASRLTVVARQRGAAKSEIGRQVIPTPMPAQPPRG